MATSSKALTATGGRGPDHAEAKYANDITATGLKTLVLLVGSEGA